MRVVLRENFHQFFTRHANDERSDSHGQSPKALLDTLQVCDLVLASLLCDRPGGDDMLSCLWLCARTPGVEPLWHVL
jgi:hypothetical protein